MNRVPSGVTLLVIATVIGGVYAVTLPAGAIQIDITASDDLVRQGSTVTFTSEVTFQSGENIPIEAIEFHLLGKQPRKVAFDLNGNTRTDQPWVRSITRIYDNTSFSRQSTRYGYNAQTGQNVTFGSGRGYGDNTGNGMSALQFKVSVDTDQLPHGEYRAKTFVIASDGRKRYDYSSAGSQFVVVERPPEGEAGQPLRLGIQSDVSAGQSSGQVEAVETVANEEDLVNRDPITGFDPFVGIVLLVAIITIVAAYLSLEQLYTWYRGL